MGSWRFRRVRDPVRAPAHHFDSARDDDARQQDRRDARHLHHEPCHHLLHLSRADVRRQQAAVRRLAHLFAPRQHRVDVGGRKAARRRGDGLVLPRRLSSRDCDDADRVFHRQAPGGARPRVPRQTRRAQGGEGVCGAFGGRRAMISPETIDRIKALMEEASVFEEDLEESFILGGGPGGQKTNKTSNVVRLSHEPSGLMVRCGETRSRETNRWLARRMLAELILERERGRKSAARQAAEKIRRQKRRRSRRQKQKMLDDKHAHSEIKRLRRTIPSDD